MARHYHRNWRRGGAGEMLKVLVVDDHRLIAAALRDTIDRVEDLQTVGVAHNASDALSAVTRAQPDVVVLSVKLPDMPGLECLDHIRRDYPSIKVVMLGDDLGSMPESLSRGATAFIVKSVNPLDIPPALRQIYEGTVYHAPAGLTSTPENPGREAGLTDREIEMLKAVARGLSNKAISKQFWVTEQTVKFHLNNVYRKLGVPNRTAAATYAYEHGLVSEAG